MAIVCCVFLASSRELDKYLRSKTSSDSRETGIASEDIYQYKDY